MPHGSAHSRTRIGASRRPSVNSSGNPACTGSPPSRGRADSIFISPDRSPAQFPASSRSFLPVSGDLAITDCQATSLAFFRNSCEAAGPKSIVSMPALACRSRSALIRATFSSSSAFEPERGVGEHLALRVVQALPLVEIDQHVDLDAVEGRVHAELGDLLPAEIENAERSASHSRRPRRVRARYRPRPAAW